jgi:hypothetical protein
MRFAGDMDDVLLAFAMIAEMGRHWDEDRLKSAE